MKTKVIKINSQRPQKSSIESAAEILRRGSLVAFPTETVYGLGANAFDPKAIRKIFKAKGRPSDNPLIIHIAEKDQLNALVRAVPPAAKKLIRKFWPGPLTLILKKSKRVPKEISAGLSSVAVRLPKNKIARELIKSAGFPLAAPSANISGKPSPTSARHVFDDLNGIIPLILDGGRAHVGLESTVLDLTSKIPTVLRPGKITVAQLRAVLGKVNVQTPKTGPDEKGLIVKSPGLKYRHYAPNANMIIVEGKPNDVYFFIQTLIYERRNKKVGVIAFQRKYRYDRATVKFGGTNPNAIARNLFRLLREFDEQKIDLIISEGLQEKGIAEAVMNRLRKAAGFSIRKV